MLQGRMWNVTGWGPRLCAVGERTAVEVMKHREGERERFPAGGLARSRGPACAPPFPACGLQASRAGSRLTDTLEPSPGSSPQPTCEHARSPQAPPPAPPAPGPHSLWAAGRGQRRDQVFAQGQPRLMTKVV